LGEAAGDEKEKESYLLLGPTVLLFMDFFPNINSRREFMKKILMLSGLVLLIASFALAGAPKTYQVTGPVLDVKDDIVTVQKGNDKWEIAFDKDTKVTGGELKKGAKVTIYYTMKAASVEIKEAAKPAPKKK
jgi:hypothetical protein